MELALTLILTWVVLLFLYYSKKTLSFLQNIIIFMLLTIILRNYTTIVTLELKLIKNSLDNLLFVVFLIKREIIFPYLVLIFINYYLLSKSLLQKSITFIVCLGFMNILDFLAVHYHVINYIQWNLFYSFLVDIALLFCGLILARVVSTLINRGESKNESI